MLESFKHYGIFLVIAIVVASVLLSNKAGVNLTHHHNLPQLIQKNKVYCSGVIFKHCSVRLTTEIGPRETYQDVLQLLSDASRFDTITFYLSGNGGQVHSLIQLVNGIKHTKAHTIAVVEGDVYSAHADLAIAMDELVVGRFVNFIFHRSSAYGQHAVCDKAKGQQDRMQDLEQKCKDYLEAHLRVDAQLIRVQLGRYLTPDEIERVLDGEDVIINGDVMASRTAAYGK